MNKSAVIIPAIALAIGWGLGYYATPSEVVEKTNTVIKRDVVVKYVKKPDGTEETTTTDKTKEESSSSKESKRKKLDWTVSAAYLAGRDNKSEIVGSLYRRVIGTVSIGAVASSNGLIGLGVSFQF